MYFKIIFSLCCMSIFVEAAIVRMAVDQASLWSSSQTFMLSDEDEGSISLSSELICTRDLDGSACAVSCSILAGSQVEFLLSDSGLAKPLEVGEMMSAETELGMWGQGAYNAYEFIVSRYPVVQGGGGLTGGEHAIAFRVREDKVRYKYGWLELGFDSSLNGRGFTSVAVSDGAVDGVRFLPVPEPSSLMLFLMGMPFVWWRFR